MVPRQDAELAAIQRILAGEQYMTVYKAIKPEAEAAAELAFSLAKATTPPTSLINGKVNNGTMDVTRVQTGVTTNYALPANGLVYVDTDTTIGGCCPARDSRSSRGCISSPLGCALK